jgi:SWI/SNF-related matrix-associated actin-dependent regulator 1 of chromatin subfamily A
LEAVDFLEEHSRALLADEMGTGKTIAVIGLLHRLHYLGQHPRRVGIVCPKSLVLNWRSELGRWYLPPAGREADVLIANYESRRYDDWSELDLLVVDEAHMIKTPSAKRSARVRKLAERSRRIALLSGTPMQSKPAELWNLLDLLQPDAWGTFRDYSVRYCDGQEKTIGFTRGDAYLGIPSRRKTVWDASGISRAEELHDRLVEGSPGQLGEYPAHQRVMLRRLKRDVLDLPPKRRMILEVTVRGVDDSDLLRQLSSDGEVTRENYEEVVRRLTTVKVLFEEWSRRRHEQALAKVDAVVEHAKNLLAEAPKLVVFAHHVDVAREIAGGLGPHGSLLLTGAVSARSRQEIVERFQGRGASRVLVATMQAAGTGLTLTAASVVLFAELDPVPAVVSQAEARVDRIGQREPVLIQHLVVDRSLDARIAKILVQKQDLIDVVMDGGRRSA